MPKSKTFIQGYNAQAAVDADCQIIIACDLVNRPSDSVQLPTMVSQIPFQYRSKAGRAFCGCRLFPQG